MTPELMKALRLYRRVFRDMFPTIPLAMSRKDEEVIEIINECVEKGKNVYELGYLDLDINIMY